MPKNYYLILGIPSDSSLDDIKDAYRRLAKEFHPDRYGDNHGPFQAIQEAYSVLSDPVKRHNHDLSVRFRRKKPPESMTAASVSRGRPGMGRPPSVEPLIPGQDRPVWANQPRPDRYSRPSAFDNLFSWPFRDLAPAYRPKSPQGSDINMVVTLSPAEAARGGQIRVLIPAMIRCPVCSGKGWTGPYECRECSGQGNKSGEYSLMLNYPAGISPGHQLQIPLDHYGKGQRRLTVYFRISRM